MNEQFGKIETPRWEVVETLINKYDLRKIAEIGIFHADMACKVLHGARVTTIKQF